jgi:hypothetical protein
MAVSPALLLPLEVFSVEGEYVIGTESAKAIVGAIAAAINMVRIIFFILFEDKILQDKVPYCPRRGNYQQAYN